MLSLSNQSAGSVHLSVERALERALERKPLSPAKGVEQIAESIEFRDALDSHTEICIHSTVALSDTSWVCQRDVTGIDGERAANFLSLQSHCPSQRRLHVFGGILFCPPSTSLE